MANYLNVPSGSGASTPNQAGLAVGTTSLDLRVEFTPLTWQPASFANIINQYVSGAGSGTRFYFAIQSSPWQPLYVFFNSLGGQPAAAAAAYPFVDGTSKGLRVLHNVAAGTVDFYTSDDFTVWTHYDSQTTGLATTGMDTAGTPPALTIGKDADTGVAPGKYTKVQVIVNGVTIINWNITTATVGNGPWVAGTGETWTRSGTASVIAAATGPAAGSCGLLGVGA